MKRSLKSSILRDHLPFKCQRLIALFTYIITDRKHQVPGSAILLTPT